MLTDAQCRNASCPPEKKHVRLSDAGNLYLEVTPNGSKRWFWKYRLNSAEKRLALGSYPAVSLTNARLDRDAAKAVKASGMDPVQTKQVSKMKAAIPAGDTFKATAMEWFDLKADEWGTHHKIRERRNIEKDLIPFMGKRRISEIEPVELLVVIRKIEERGSYSAAHRVLTTAGGVWRYAVSTGRAARDITSDLRGALKTHTAKNFSAILDPSKFGVLLHVIDGYQGGAIVRAGLKLAPLLFQRPGELRAAAWSEFDLDKALWTIPAMRMKRRKAAKENGEPHFVPLSTQAIAILKGLHPITGHGTLLFPGERSHDRPISDNTLNAALRTMGYGSDIQHVHGFRASARTMIDEQLEIDERLIEAQLAHVVKDANGTSYNRAKYMVKRAAMMQTWADYLDKLRQDAIVTPLQPAAFSA